MRSTSNSVTNLKNRRQVFYKTGIKDAKTKWKKCFEIQADYIGDQSDD